MRRVWLSVLMLACQGTAADHEALGDRAYLASRHGEALVEYRIALVQRAPDGRLRAKAGAAALHAGELLAAVEEYRALGQEDRDRVGEAVDGLQRVAEQALRVRDRAALRAAITALRELAAGRALTGFGPQLAEVLGEHPAASEALTLLPYAAALAPDAGREDSLLHAYGDALRRAGRCEAALPVYEGIARRQRAPGAAADAAAGAAGCAVELGQRELGAGRPQEARVWFERAVQSGDNTAAGRTAYVGLGDVAAALGDIEAAIDAYFRAQAGAAPGDTIAVRAVERINRLMNAGTLFPR